MEEEKELTWKERFTRMRKHYGWKYSDLAKMLGCSANGMRSVMSENGRELPHHWKLSIIIFEIENNLLQHSVLL